MPKLLSIGRDLSPRLRWYVLVTIVTGVPVVAGAVWAAAAETPGTRTMIGVWSFFVLALLAEWRPVPIDIEGKRLVSLAFVFIVSSQLLFGWQWSILIGAFAIGIAMVMDHHAPIKAVFTAVSYAIAAGLASLPLLAFGSSPKSYGLLATAVVISGSIFVVANVLLVCVAIALATESNIQAVFRDHLRFSGPIFAISVFVAAQAVILWRLSPPLVILLSAPLFALTMYQRSSVRGRIAEEAASTDSLTSLKNRRAFEVETASALMTATAQSSKLALCLIDIDRFKQVNDRHGHAMGDAVLQVLAAAIEQTVPGNGFRLGGDEFVLHVPTRNYAEVLAGIQTRFVRGQASLSTLGETVTVSVGVAIYPDHADELHMLQKRADLALYRSKYGGRACITLYDRRGCGDALRLLGDERCGRFHRAARCGWYRPGTHRQPSSDRAADRLPHRRGV